MRKRQKRAVKIRKCTSCGVALPEGPQPIGPDERPNPWVGTDGRVAHPDSPSGAGGSGHFRIPGTIDGVGKESRTVPQPLTRLGRNHVLSGDEVTALDDSKKPPPKKNPPPTTNPRTIERKAAKNSSNVAVDLKIQILADVTDHPGVEEGHADTGPVEGEDSFTASFEWADIEFDEGTKKVTKIDGVNTLKGLIQLQIRYAEGVKPADKVAYGRGTTTDDIANGDITIGFHEHCHLTDWVNYLTTSQLPLDFKGKKDMTVEDYQQKQTDLEDKFQQFIDAGDALTLAQTDEVGKPTRSAYLASK